VLAQLYNTVRMRWHNEWVVKTAAQGVRASQRTKGGQRKREQARWGKGNLRRHQSVQPTDWHGDRQPSNVNDLLCSNAEGMHREEEVSQCHLRRAREGEKMN
jgi:hypothetical protein